MLYGCACLKDKTSQPKQNQWPFRFFTQLKFEGTGQNLTISFWLEWYGLVAKGLGSHPRGAGSIPGTESNWPGQRLTRMLDYLFFEHIFAVFKLRGQLKATSASAATTVTAGQMLFEMSSSFFLVYLHPKYEWNLCFCFLLYKRKRDFWSMITNCVKKIYSGTLKNMFAFRQILIVWKVLN